ARRAQAPCARACSLIPLPMACSSGGRPARRRLGRALHQPEECATSLFHQTRDTTPLTFEPHFIADEEFEDAEELLPFLLRRIEVENVQLNRVCSIVDCVVRGE